MIYRMHRAIVFLDPNDGGLELQRQDTDDGSMLMIHVGRSTCVLPLDLALGELRRGLADFYMQTTREDGGGRSDGRSTGGRLG